MLGFSTIDDDARNPIGGLTISLGTSVGALLAGLLVGHLRTRHPLFGRIPDGAVTLMTSLGLAAFVAMTSLHAGPIFFSALKADAERLNIVLMPLDQPFGRTQ